MGHERVGALPRTKKWRDVVAQMSDFSGSEVDAAAIASAILLNVKSQFSKIHSDNSVIAAFQFLVALAKSGSSEQLSGSSFLPSIDLEVSSTPLKIIGQLRSWVVAQDGSREYADIATKASADAISLWSASQSMQGNLFTSPGDPREIWERANNAAGFCEISRLFFSKFTERYLNYFLEREASASMASVTERDQLAYTLRDHIDGVSKFAFETSRITQSFAAGWFNNHARNRYPSKEESRGFLNVAFGKMREELRREANANA